MFFTHIGFRARKNRNKANKNYVSVFSQQRLRTNQSVSFIYTAISNLILTDLMKRPLSQYKDCD